MHRGSATDFAQSTAGLLLEGRIQTRQRWLGRMNKGRGKKRKVSEKI